MNDETLDGWYRYETEKGLKRWEIYDSGVFLISFNEDFKDKLLNHPRVIEAYEEYIKQREVK